MRMEVLAYILMGLVVMAIIVGSAIVITIPLWVIYFLVIAMIRRFK